jgi:hypothetical protein
MAAVKVFEYRQHAQECLRLAGSLPTGEHRIFLLEMARAWHRLAQDHEGTGRSKTEAPTQ